MLHLSVTAQTAEWERNPFFDLVDMLRGLIAELEALTVAACPRVERLEGDRGSLDYVVYHHDVGDPVDRWQVRRCKCAVHFRADPDADPGPHRRRPVGTYHLTRPDEGDPIPV